MGSSVRLALVGALVTLLVACSPYSYSTEIAKVSDGVNKLSDAFTSGLDNIASDRIASTQITIIDNRNSGKQVLVSPNCERSNAKPGEDPCALYLDGTAPPTLTPAERDRAKAMEAIKVLKDYANALAAVTNAADRTAYDAAVGNLAAAVGTLTAAANAAVPGASAALSAAVNIFGWLVGAALDEQRYDSLKKAVTKVNEPVLDGDPRSAIRIVTDTLGSGLVAIKVARMEILGNEVDALVGGLNKGGLSEEAYRKRLVDAQAALAVIDGLRKSDARGAASNLAEAHEKLAKAIADPDKNRAAFLKAVGDFGEKVGALEAALKATSPGATAKKGS